MEVTVPVKRLFHRLCEVLAEPILALGTCFTLLLTLSVEVGASVVGLSQWTHPLQGDELV